MAAMDGNPTRKDAWETSRDRRTEESILREKGWPDTEDSDGSGTGNELPANQKIVPGGIPGAASETPPASVPTESASSPSADDTEDSLGGSVEPAEDDLDDTSEARIDPLNDQFLMEEAQLSSLEGVPEGMGTIALERMPLDPRAANQVGAGLAGQLVGNLGQMTDAEIMRRAGAGDEACFDFLIAKYRRPIISFLYRMVHNQAVAEELAQEVFLRVYRARATYRAEARFSTWLYRIASNMAINHARNTKLERASPSVYLDQADDETGTKPDVADVQPIAEQSMLRDERIRRIREHVMALPERQRMAVVMHKYQDMDYREIGAVLKLSESATKSLLFRAYQTLRERLKEFA